MKKKKKGKNNYSTNVEKQVNSTKEDKTTEAKVEEKDASTMNSAEIVTTKQTDETAVTEEKLKETETTEDTIKEANVEQAATESEQANTDSKESKSNSKESKSNSKESKSNSKESKPDSKESKSDELSMEKDTESDAELTDFIREILKPIKEWMKSNRKICLVAASICAVSILVIIVVCTVTKKRDSQIVNATTSINAATTATIQNETIPVPQEPLQDASPEIIELITQYFTAMQNNDIETLATLRDYIDTVDAAKLEVKHEYVEAYQNLVCYTKPGPFENSYIVYVVCDIKFVNWDEPAPSILGKIVCSRDDGSLYVYEGDLDSNVKDYIYAISCQQDVEDLFTRVKTEYSELLASNSEFAAYMDALNQTIKDGVGEVLAAEIVSDDTAIAASENSVSNNDNTAVAEVNEDSEENGGAFEVKTTTTVNVRMSDSEEADKMGKVEGGTVLTCNEQLANGWSEVVYEGEIGYIKTEYLVKVDSEGNETQSASTEKITVAETVNIRETPDTDGKKVGVAYAGESFTFVEDMGNGWTKIIYNDKEAYIKTEYIVD